MSADAHGSNSPPAAGLETAHLERLSQDARYRVRVIYEEAFPIRQRVPFDELEVDARRGDEIALVGLEQGRPVGLAFLSRLESAGCLFLEYYAVAIGLRGAGRGQSLWMAVAGELAECRPRRAIVLEVEDPSESDLDAAEAALRVRRARFWERVGARALPVEEYVIPNIDGTGVESMRLMWMPGPLDREAPAGQELCELVLALYKSGYGLGPDHALAQRALAALG